MMNSPSTKKPKLSEQVFDRLREMVLHNELKVGNYYLEQELAEQLGTSRTPLREAAIRLEQEGLVNIIPRRGVFIRPVSAKEMKEIYEVLSCLEVAAIKAVCRQKLAGERLAELEAAQTAMKEALAKDDLECWALNDKRFHQLLVEFSDNHELSRLVNGYWDKTDRVRNLTLRLRKPPQQSTEEHREVIEALKAGDAEHASQLHIQHRQRASDELTKLLEVLDHAFG
ncbi:GntR family transcriptional regulator [Aestuariirhabdus sp. Z084]|uniref:GntR family transcriptional regulator n=1 Tax=Aestuariirhabdus haliotis TaxID=2918751 RepID=UPI0020C10D47|nr:GntR family transcriptional regulator [Aestuariirhabdus haliotis]MCL6416104.1 GntR family transcriptional regulator [Aestuariirhabdus haliotis]